MNKYTIFILFFILFASCNNKNNNIVYTLDNPSERIVWEKLRLMDPVTREIPRDIRKKERMFAKTLPKENNQINNSWIHRGPYNVGGRTRAIALDVLNENIPAPNPINLPGFNGFNIFFGFYDGFCGLGGIPEAS